MSDDMNLQPLPPVQWDSSLKRVIEDMQGKPLHVHALLAHNPALLDAWWSSRQYLVGGGSLGPRLGELVILRVGVRMRCWYEWAAHVVRGQAAGLSLDEVKCVLAGVSSSDWTEAEAVILDTVDALFDQRGLSPALMERFGQHYSRQQLLDLMAIQGMYQFLGCVLNTWNPKLEPRVLSALPESESWQSFDARLAGIEHTQAVDESSLIAASKLRLRVLLTRDWLLLKKLLHPSLRYIHATGVTQDYDTYLGSLKQGNRYRTAESNIESVYIHGDLGVIAGSLSIYVQRVDGSEYCGRSKITEIWHWNGNSWLLSSFQSTAI